MYIRTSSFVSFETTLHVILQGFVDPKCNTQHGESWIRTRRTKFHVPEHFDHEFGKSLKFESYTRFCIYHLQAMKQTPTSDLFTPGGSLTKVKSQESNLQSRYSIVKC